MIRRIYQSISWVSLAATILPSVLYLAGNITLDQSKLYLLLSTLGWFAATPMWMGRDAQPA